MTIIELLLRTALEYLQDINARRNKYEAALRRELATLRARKQTALLWGDYDVDEFYVWPWQTRVARWCVDRTEGNWGKYLQREKEIRKSLQGTLSRLRRKEI